MSKIKAKNFPEALFKDREEVLTDFKFNPLDVRKFWDYTIRPSDDECWDWRGSKHDKGYARMRVGKKPQVIVTRFSYALHYGNFPKRLFVCHKCDNPSCHNPTHLFLGNQKENMQDCSRKKRNAWGEKKSKLTQQQVVEGCILYLTGEWTPKQIAERFRTTEAAIDGFLFKGYWRNLISPFVREKLREVSKKKNNRKLTTQKAAEIREIYKSQKHNITQLAKLFDVSPRTIRDIINNKTWKNSD